MKEAGSDIVRRSVSIIQQQQRESSSWDYSDNNNVGFHAPSSSEYTSKAMIHENKRLNMERNDFSEWVEHVAKQLIDDDTTTQEETAASESFQTDNDTFRPKTGLERHSSDGSNNNNNAEANSNMLLSSLSEFGDCHNYLSENRNNNNNKQDDQVGLGQLTLLLECAVAISVDNLGEAHKMLLELTQMASPYGPSCAERIVAYFAKAMASRVINSWLGICSPLVDYKSIHSAFQVFNNVSPFIKFAHFTSNQAILEAVHRHGRVHIIDLDIMQGLQWPALFHILATRMEGPPHLRMTGMGTSMELLAETGKQLSNFAKRLGLPFEFIPLGKKFGEADISMLQLRRGETLAVHWLQHSLYDATGPDWKTLRLLEQLSPRIITLVEQDISHGGSFLDRFVGSLHYYSTLFDSLGAYLPCDDGNRHRVEHSLMYREVNNILAIGGPARSGEDKFRQWRSELSNRSSSFVQVPMSANSMAQAQLILNMFPSANGYRLIQGDGTLKLGWKDTSLYTASVWTSSSSSHGNINNNRWN